MNPRHGLKRGSQVYKEISGGGGEKKVKNRPVERTMSKNFWGVGEMTELSQGRVLKGAVPKRYKPKESNGQN